MYTYTYTYIYMYIYIHIHQSGIQVFRRQDLVSSRNHFNFFPCDVSVDSLTAFGLVNCQILMFAEPFFEHLFNQFWPGEFHGLYRVGAESTETERLSFSLNICLTNLRRYRRLMKTPVYNPTILILLNTWKWKWSRSVVSNSLWPRGL